MVVEDPVFKRDNKYFLSTEESFDSAMRKNVHYIEILKSGKLNESNGKAYFERYLGIYIYIILLDCIMIILIDLVQ